MEYSTVDMKKCVVVRLGGRLDGSIAPELETRLQALTDSGHYKLIIVMNDVTYVSSAALRALITLSKTCRRWNRGDMRIAEIQPGTQVKASFDLTGLSGEFRLFNTEAEAIASFNSDCLRR